MKNKKESAVIQTYTGKMIDILNFKVENVNVLDIAHSLSNLSRFTGHVKSFYSIAAHSLMVCDYVMRKLAGSHHSSKNDEFEIALQALLHDASEAYLHDIPSPLKHTNGFQFYRDLEHKIQDVIMEAVSLPKVFHPLVHKGDEYSLAVEVYHLMDRDNTVWAPLLEKLPDPVPQLLLLTPEEAETEFLERLKQLC